MSPALALMALVGTITSLGLAIIGGGFLVGRFMRTCGWCGRTICTPRLTQRVLIVPVEREDGTTIYALSWAHARCEKKACQ